MLTADNFVCLFLGMIFGMLFIVAFMSTWMNRRHREEHSEEINLKFKRWVSAYEAEKKEHQRIRNEVLYKYGIDIDKDEDSE